MINILIDTCSWIDLLTDGNNILLPHLEFWQNNNCINLITHELVILEWNQHKEERRNHFTASLTTKYKHAKEIIKRENLSIPPNIEPKIENINNQIYTIDRLLNEAVKLETPNEIKGFCSDRTIKPRKAPFHNKLDSTKDAYIIFSALKYFTEIQQDFIFISSNKDDFGAPTNLGREIHPEIIEDFTEIKVTYFSEIGQVINELKKELPLILITDSDTTLQEKNRNEEIVIDKTKTILEQIYEYLSIRKKEITFIPTHILTRHYPFKKTVNSVSYYSVFSVTTDNEELSDLFKLIEISDNDDIKFMENSLYQNIPDYENKFKTVLLSLTQNLIFTISNSKTHENINIRYTDNDKYCECPKCDFGRFKFVHAFNNLNTSSESIQDLLKLAYVHYKIGNYIKASNYLKIVTLKSHDSSLFVTEFISQYNLSKLSIFIRNNYWGENAQDELVNELYEINLNESFQNFITIENKKIIEWIRDDKFISNSKEKIQKTTSEIIDHYYSQLNGGWSLNSDIWKLINDYAEIEAFLNENYIIYDKFYDFKELCSVFFEGLFASHAIDESQQSRLESFDDWLIIQLLYYSDADTINKLFSRYKLKKIKYKETTTGDSFNKLIDNFLLRNSLLKETFWETCEQENRDFWEYYNSLFNNILTIVSICDFDSVFYDSFTEKLITYLEIENFTYFHTIKYINTFLKRCGNKLNINILEKFFQLTIKKRKYHTEGIFETFSEILINRKENLNITQPDFEIIKNIAFEECMICNSKHSYTDAISFYQIIQNELYKKEITEIINHQLENSFDFQLFYLATIYDIIDFNEELFNKAINYTYSTKKRVSFRSSFTNETENRYASLNDIINLCFKFSIDTNNEIFSKSKEIDDYYNWLLDMDHFDYNKFQPSWIGESVTRYYFRKIGTNQKVKKALDKYLLNNFDSKLEKLYVHIFIRKKWKNI